MKKLKFDNPDAVPENNEETNDIFTEQDESKSRKQPSNLIQRSWSSTGFSTTTKSSRVHTRSKSAQKLSQYDYSAIYKRKREDKIKQLEEESKAQANSFKSRPMPNFLNKKPQINFGLKITVPITPEVLKRSRETGARKKEKVCGLCFVLMFSLTFFYSFLTGKQSWNQPSSNLQHPAKRIETW